MANQIINPAAPNLPLGTPEYQRQYQDQFANVLRLYFNQIRNALSELFNKSGGKYISFPYGSFSSYTSQTAVINTATLVTLSTIDYKNDVSISASKITVANAGIYNLQLRIQLQSVDAAVQTVYIWIKKNGTDVVGSTGLVKVPASGATVVSWNGYLSLVATNYVEIYWSTSDVDVTIQYYAASALPTKPSTASVTATMLFVSSLL